MQLLMEFLAPKVERYEDQQLLLEVLGNLDVIDKKLIKVLQKERPYFSGSKKPHGAEQVSHSLGQGSEVTTVEVKKDKDILGKLSGDVVALVLKRGDKQVLILADKAKIRGSRDRDKDGYLFMANAALADLDKMTAQFVSPDRTTYKNGRPQKVEDWEGKRWVKNVMDKELVNINSGEAKKLLKLAFDQGVEVKEPVTLLLISRDKARVAKQAARVTARRGVVPLPDDKSLSGSGKDAYNKYIKDLRYELGNKLDQFKSSRVGDKFATPEEMLKGISDKGFMQKLKFMDYTYDKYDVDNNLRDLMRGVPERYGPHVAVVYNINTDSAEYKKLQNDLQAIRTELKDAGDLAWDEYKKRRDVLAPPGKLKIAFELKGGTLVPGRVIFDKDISVY